MPFIRKGCYGSQGFSRIKRPALNAQQDNAPTWVTGVMNATECVVVSATAGLRCVETVVFIKDVWITTIAAVNMECLALNVFSYLVSPVQAILAE